MEIILFITTLIFCNILKYNGKIPLLIQVAIAMLSFGLTDKICHVCTSLHFNKAALWDLSQLMCHTALFHHSVINGKVGFPGGQSWTFKCQPVSRDAYHLTEETKNKGWCSQHGGLKIPFSFCMKSSRERFTADVMQQLYFICRSTKKTHCRAALMKSR